MLKCSSMIRVYPARRSAAAWLTPARRPARALPCTGKPSDDLLRFGRYS